MFAAYRYYSDDGNVYQVLLDSDLASTFDYEAASGLEAYLPAGCSPRYVQYQNPATGAAVAAVITRGLWLSSPPPEISISGSIYIQKGARGEDRFAFLPQAIPAVQGPPGVQGEQGPPGPAGVMWQAETHLTSNLSHSAGVDTLVLYLPLDAPGTYRFDYMAYVQGSAAEEQGYMWAYAPHALGKQLTSFQWCPLSSAGSVVVRASGLFDTLQTGDQVRLNLRAAQAATILAGGSPDYGWTTWLAAQRIA